MSQTKIEDQKQAQKSTVRTQEEEALQQKRKHCSRTQKRKNKQKDIRKEKEKKTAHSCFCSQRFACIAFPGIWGNRHILSVAFFAKYVY